MPDNSTTEAEAAKASIAMSASSLRAKILAAQDVPERLVDVPEWDCQILMRGLTGKQRDAFEAEVFVIKGTGKNIKSDVQRVNIRARLCALSIVDPDTKQQLFNDTDIEQLGNKAVVVLDRLYTIAQELSGMREEDIEELEKN